jgi:ecotin
MARCWTADGQLVGPAGCEQDAETPARLRAIVMPLLKGRPSACRRLLLPLLLLGTVGLGAARAIPRLDLKPYPQPAAGEKRWVIQLPGVLPPTSDARLSPSTADWRVELIVGKEMSVDCNGPRLNGRIRSETIQGWGYKVYRVSQVGPGPSTRMACPPDQGPRQAFVSIGSKPFVVPYNVSLPIVIYTPKDVQVRWRLWKAERQQRNATAL